MGKSKSTPKIIVKPIHTPRVASIQCGGCGKLATIEITGKGGLAFFCGKCARDVLEQLGNHLIHIARRKREKRS